MKNIILTLAILLISGTLLCAQPSAAPGYRNLVFEGGGIRGVAYAGALGVIEEQGILKNIERTAGTSVGAIAAMLVSLGYSSAAIDKIMTSLKVQEFNDGRFIFFGGFYRFFHKYGWYRGIQFERWLGNQVRERTGTDTLTFAQLHQLHLRDPAYKDLFVTGTNLSAQRTELFSWTTTPGMSIKTAVRISMSIPLYFSAVLLDTNGHVIKNRRYAGPYSVMVDGGLTANYPIAVFDTNGVYNRTTLGLKLERPEQIEGFRKSKAISGYTINSMSSYIAALYNYTIENLNRKDQLLDEDGRTIYISTQHIQPKVRAMKKSEKDLLYQSGKDAATRFFSK